MIPILDIIFQNDRFYILFKKEGEKLNYFSSANKFEIITIERNIIKDNVSLHSDPDFPVSEEYIILETKDHLKEIVKMKRLYGAQFFIRKMENNLINTSSSEKTNETTVYKTVNGKDYTYREWVEYEQKSYEEYLLKKKR